MIERLFRARGAVVPIWSRGSCRLIYRDLGVPKGRRAP